MQLLFYAISWHLAFETAEIGHARGLIRCLRVDRLVLANEDGNARRSSDADHDDALARLQRLWGGSFTVHSHGRPVARLTPVSQGPSTAVRRALLARLAAQPASGEPRSWQPADLPRPG